jgi:PKD repeat protein
MIRTLSSLFVALALVVATVAPAQAQTKRAGDTFYLKLGGGFSDYTGDFSDPFEGFSDGDGFPYTWLGEVGYKPSSAFSVGLAYQAGRFPLVNNDLPDTDPDRLSGQLLGRYTFGAKKWTVAPYVDAGANLSFTGSDTGFGPTVGAGLDIVLNDWASFYVESRANFTFDDESIDNPDPPQGGTSFDALSEAIGIGVTMTFSTATTPPRVIAVDGPTDVQTGESLTYSATVNEDEATRPLTYQWDFGDGSTGSGLTASHTFRQPGTYTVTFTASNTAGEASESITVNAVRPPQPAQITQLDAEPNPVDEGETVSFTTDAEGDSPISYMWDFGDGSTGSGADATHTYDDPGTYTVELTASNEAGEDTRTLTMTVERALPPICMSVSEFNGAFFNRNSSTLTEEGRSALQENLDILSQCPNLDVRIEGFAAPGERNAQSLSEDRARAAAQFYQDGGIPASRITTSGEGQPEGMTSKKGGTQEFRRVDSIPQR